LASVTAVPVYMYAGIQRLTWHTPHDRPLFSISYRDHSRAADFTDWLRQWTKGAFTLLIASYLISSERSQPRRTGSCTALWSDPVHCGCDCNHSVLSWDEM